MHTKLVDEFGPQAALSVAYAVQIQIKNEGILRTMAIEKKSLISNRSVSTKSAGKTAPTVAKLQTAVRLTKATHAITALRVGKFTTAKIIN